ncbi:hypothetical protein NUSPORA_00166 [Nucleospora cyclopteri]
MWYELWNIFRIFLAVFFGFFHVLILSIYCLFLKMLRLNSAGSKFRQFGINYLFHITSTFVRIITGDKIFIAYNKNANVGSKMISIGNHIIDFDFISSSKCFYDLNLFKNMTYIGKKAISNYPLIGFIFDTFKGICVDRDNKNSPFGSELKKFKEFKNLNTHNIFIYPEGSIFNETGYEKSLKFAQKTNITVNNELLQLKNLLVPRIRGFFTVVSEVSNYDTVISLTTLMNPYERELAGSKAHKKLVITKEVSLSQIIIVDSLSGNQIKDHDFLYKEFLRKDQILEKYKNGKYKRAQNVEDIKKIIFDIFPNENYEIRMVTYYTNFSILLILIVVMIVWLIIRIIYKLIRPKSVININIKLKST